MSTTPPSTARSVGVTFDKDQRVFKARLMQAGKITHMGF